ncbi:MAG: xylulokinase [Clostridia bacterium]|nr:xylulokinase [Clostridia bacterium]
MAILLGIDLGTSSVKAMLVNSDTSRVLACENVSYDVSIPSLGRAEQSPQMWYAALIEVFGKLRESEPDSFASIASIAISGQMHGLVITGDDDECVSPAIIWLDQRSKPQIDEIYQKVSFEEMRDVFKNRVSVGFAFPSLLWVRENEPETFARAKHIMMPADYIRLKLTGVCACDASNASSSTIFDIEKRDWAWDIIDRFGLDRDLFPPVGESCDAAGEVCARAAGETGLRAGTPVVFGAGDQPCYSLGIGVIGEGALSTSIGTGGQLAAYSDGALCDKWLRTHTFCHAVKSGYTVFGATLSAGLSLNWLRHRIIHADSYKAMDEMAKTVPAGCEGLIYLPYLTGERTPYMNPDCRAMFLGLTLGMDDRYMTRAVMEGVVFSLRDCLAIINDMGLDSDTIVAAGTGAVSGVWLQMQADILSRRVITCAGVERAAVGACIIAGVGAGAYSTYEEACRALVSYSQVEYLPNPDNRGVYDDAYERYRKAYRDNFR